MEVEYGWSLPAATIRAEPLSPGSPLPGRNVFTKSGSSFRRGRVGKTRDCYSREAGSSPAAGASSPRGRNGDDAGPSTRKLRVRVPPGVLVERSSGCRGVGHPTGFGRRRSQVRLLPARLRGRGEAVLASL